MRPNSKAKLTLSDDFREFCVTEYVAKPSLERVARIASRYYDMRITILDVQSALKSCGIKHRGKQGYSIYKAQLDEPTS